MGSGLFLNSATLQILGGDVGAVEECLRGADVIWTQVMTLVRYSTISQP